jgi:hypothetical protein
MKSFIKQRLLENLLPREELVLKNINEITNDSLYDSLLNQSEQLKKGEISFNGELMFVMFDKRTKELAAASWLENNPAIFSPHFIIKESYRGLKLYPQLFQANLKKYEQMKQVRPDFSFLLNAVNPKLGDQAMQYGFEPYKNMNNYFIYKG